MTSPAGFRDNRAELVTVVALGRIAPARILSETLQPDRQGQLRTLPSGGGIALGLHAGDAVSRASARVADHAVPGVSAEAVGDHPAVPGDFHLLSCVGNDAYDEEGTWLGRVAGKRGGLAPGFWGPQLLGIEVDDDHGARLVPGRHLAVHAVGRGLEILDAPDVTLTNCSPWVLDQLPAWLEGHCLVLPVRCRVPAVFSGAGLGQDAWIGDVEVTNEEVLPADLAFADLIAFDDLDGAHGRFCRSGWTTVGLVSHGPSGRPGHGVGITVLASGPAGALRVELDPGAGLGEALRRLR